MPRPRVLVLHNRYRLPGGEERAVELHVGALERAGIAHSLIERDSSDASPLRAGVALVRGGDRERDVADAVRSAGADVVHFHNMLPLFGPRGLAAAREAGAKVVLHLHNYRLFCNVYAGFRDGHACFRCRGRNTLPGLVLNCRGSLPESTAYAIGLARHQPTVFESVDRFVAPSDAARARLAWLGVPAERIAVLGHYLPAEQLSDRSAAGDGRFALAAGRVTAEKGFDVAVEAARRAGVPLRIAGDGPAMPALRELVAGSGADVELLGHLSAGELAEVKESAAMVVVPSLWEETFGLVALEGMGAGLPVAAFDIGALPEVAGAASCVTPYDAEALAGRMQALWQDPARRQAEGEDALGRARAEFTEERFVSGLLALYAEA
jgi:glycosyltransferase involved in cell wall biosynthesis